MAKQNEIINDELAGAQNGSDATGQVTELKKPFVEPAISVPVDVLEATTFFQLSESGPTNP